MLGCRICLVYTAARISSAAGSKPFLGVTGTIVGVVYRGVFYNPASIDLDASGVQEPQTSRTVQYISMQYSTVQYHLLCWYRFSVQLWVQLSRGVVIHAVHAFQTRIGVSDIYTNLFITCLSRIYYQVAGVSCCWPCTGGQIVFRNRGNSVPCRSGMVTLRRTSHVT